MNARESSLIRLVKALNAWDTPDFETALKTEIERLPAAALPLQHGMSRGSVVLDRPINAMVIAARISDRVARRQVFVPFHFREAAANLLTSPVLEPHAKMAALKVCAVRIEPAD